MVLALVELLWDSKYDESGNKSAPLQLALPFQTIETLNESSQQRQKSIESFLSGRGKTGPLEVCPKFTGSRKRTETHDNTNQTDGFHFLSSSIRF